MRRADRPDGTPPWQRSVEALRSEGGRPFDLIGASAQGASAIGAAALGALSIGALAGGRARVRRLRIDELEIGRIRFEDRSKAR